MYKLEQIMFRYPEDDVIIIDPQNEYGSLLDVFKGQSQKIVISTTSDTYINPFDLDLDYGLNDGGKNDPLKSKTEYIIAFIEIPTP